MIVRIVRARLRDERGIAMIVAILASMVVMALGLVAIDLATHSTATSAYDRKRVQAIGAAEAGIDQMLSILQANTPATLGATYCNDSSKPYSSGAAALTGTLAMSPTSQYHVWVQYYDVYPPGGDGQGPMACSSLSNTTLPASAIVWSQGTAVATGAPNSVTRTMQTQIRLTPVTGFSDAIFSNSTYSTQNNFNVTQNGDVYVNGDFNCNNASTISGSVYVQGSATLSNSCYIQGDLWADGSIIMSNTATVGHDVTSSTGSLTLNNSAKVQHNVKVATTCSTCVVGTNVLGTLTTGAVSPPPPQYQFPQYQWNSTTQAAWTAAGYTLDTISSCGALQSFLGSTPSGSTVVDATAATGTPCVQLANNTTVTLNGNLAIFLDGSFSTVNRTTFTSSVAGGVNLYVIIPYGVTCSGGNPSISMSNNTTFNNVRTFFYSPCSVSAVNKNGLTGQLYGGSVTTANNFTLQYAPMLVPGATVDGFNADVSYLREVQDQ